MVIRGKPRGNGAQLAEYLLNQADNDNVKVFDIRGTSQPNSLKKSLIEMSLTSELTKSKKGLYHAQLNPAYGEDKMAYEDWLKAASILEAELKLANQRRVIVLHEKQGRIHAHVVWERYDHEKKRMTSDSYSRLAQDRARQAMEIALSHKRTPHRNKREPEIKKTLTQLWREAKNGKEFIREALANGYVIAKGSQRRSFLVVDDTGRSFDLVRQLQGVRTKEVRERLGKEHFPTDKIVIAGIRAQQNLDAKQSAAITAIETVRHKTEEAERFKQKFKAATKEMETILGRTNEQAENDIQNRKDRMRAFLGQGNDLTTKKEELKDKLKEQLVQRERNNKQKGLDL